MSLKYQIEQNSVFCDGYLNFTTGHRHVAKIPRKSGFILSET